MKMRWMAFVLLFVANTALRADPYTFHFIQGGSTTDIGGGLAFGVGLNDSEVTAFNATYVGPNRYGCVSYQCAGGAVSGDLSTPPTYTSFAYNYPDKVVALNNNNTVVTTSSIYSYSPYAVQISMQAVPASLNPSGINDYGELIGTVSNASTGNTVGAEYINGALSTFTVPGAVSTSPTGVNDAGQIVGYSMSSDSTIHGFVDTNGVFTTLDYPGASQTFITAINNKGVEAGYYLTGNTSSLSGAQSFTYSNGVFHSVFAGNMVVAGPLLVNAINDSGELLVTQATSITSSTVFLAVPEIDANSGAGAIALLAGALLIVRGRRVRTKPICEFPS